jgi:acid phosphatase (class A)
MQIFVRFLRLACCLVVPLLFVHPGLSGAAEFHYVTIAQVDLGQLLAPPPAPGSSEEKKDLGAVIEASRNRTPQDAEAARADGVTSVLRFADVLGGGFVTENLPFALPFFVNVAADVHAIVGTAKVNFDRLRPYAIDTQVAPLLSDREAMTASHHRSGSYPSGHASFAYATAVLLAVMVPEKAADIFARAALFSQHRLVAGVHYPTDIEAGRIAGTVIAHALLRDPRFQADFATARAEVRRALGLP